MCYNKRVNEKNKSVYQEKKVKEHEIMYLFIDLEREVKAGEVVVIRSDNMGGIGAFLIGGTRVGSLSGNQPEGCLDYWTIACAIYNNRVLCDVAIRCGTSAILHNESRLFAGLKNFRRVEVEGYGIACVK